MGDKNISMFKMKPLSTLLLVCAIGLFLSCKSQQVDYSKFMGCNGPVETITDMKYYAHYSEGEWVKGQLYGTTIYRFDEIGNLIQEKWINDKGELRRTTTSDYEDGVMVQQLESAYYDFQSYDQKLTAKENDGTLIYEVSYPETTSYGPATLKIKKEGKRTITTFYSATNNDYRRTEYTYDDLGRIIEEKLFSKPDEEPWRYCRHEYENGFRIRTTMLNGIKGTAEISYSGYDEYGNWIKESEVNDNSDEHFLIYREYTYRTK